MPRVPLFSISFRQKTRLPHVPPMNGIVTRSQEHTDPTCDLTFQWPFQHENWQETRRNSCAATINKFAWNSSPTWEADESCQ